MVIFFQKFRVSNILDPDQAQNFGKVYVKYFAASESEITPCIKINKPIVVDRFSGNVMK